MFIKKFFILFVFFAWANTPLQSQEQPSTLKEPEFSTNNIRYLPELGVGFSPLSTSYHPTLIVGYLHDTTQLFLGLGTGLDINTGFDEISVPILANLRWNFSLSSALGLTGFDLQTTEENTDQLFLDLRAGMRIDFASSASPLLGFGIGYSYRSFQLESGKVLPINLSLGFERIDGNISKKIKEKSKTFNEITHKRLLMLYVKIAVVL